METAVKRTELVQMVSEALGDHIAPDHRETLDCAIAELLDAGVGIQPPEYKPPEVRIELFTLRSTRTVSHL
jgi:hypothetical protein